MKTDLQNNDKDFEQIYIAHFSKMKRFAKEYVVSDEDAENIVHDVFMDIWEKREALTFQINLVAFLFTSIKNRCIDHLRHKATKQKIVNQIYEESLHSLQLRCSSLESFDESIFQENNLEEILIKSIESLPERCRIVFVKNKIDGQKQKEIAAELDISVSTVESQISIAFKKIKADLKRIFPYIK